MEPTVFSVLSPRVRAIRLRRVEGKVASIGGLELLANGIGLMTPLGSHVLVGRRIRGEVVGVKAQVATILPFGSWDGIMPGDPVELLEGGTVIHPCEGWLGRVVDSFGQALDGRPLPLSRESYPIRTSPPDAFSRRPVGERVETQVKCVDVFVPLCRGQRLGIFAGSGVGKSTLMAMLARQVNADVIVIGLIGERGRELQAFIKDDLGPEGLARSVLIVATSDQPPLTRRQAAWTATAVAEYFRNQGKHVLLMLDSVTRFAMAQREIGLAAGEPPTTKGYTPTVFAELPRLLERSGPGATATGQGDITAIYTVLVDGDDTNDPIADGVRGILDGHIVLDRKIAEEGRYPAIDIARSISRMLPGCDTPAERAILTTVRRTLARASEMEDLARIGAYRRGTNPDTDAALAFATSAYAFLNQWKDDPLSSAESFATLYGELQTAGIDLPASALTE